MIGLSRETSASRVARSEFYLKVKTNYQIVDRWMIWLLVGQWLLAAIIAISMDWNRGSLSSLSSWSMVVMGCGIPLVLFPFALSRYCRGHLTTRLTIAAAQSGFAILLSHLSSGRIETHFHLFVSLGILAAYRDVRVFLPVLLLTTFDVLARGILWPQLGQALLISQDEQRLIQPIEHAIWFVLETLGLCLLVRSSLKQWHRNSMLQAQLRHERDNLESNIAIRTKELTTIKRFREEVLNSIDASICILDMHGTIVFTNNQWVQFAEQNGVSQSCKIGSNYIRECGIVNWGPPEIDKVVSTSIYSTLVGESDSFFCECSFPVGKDMKHYRLSVTPVPLEGQLGVAIVHVDITHLKRTELRAMALAKLLRESPDEVMIVDSSNGQMLEVNDRAVTNTSYSRRELMEMRVFSLFPEVFSEQFHTSLEQQESNSDQVVRLNSSVRRKDGSEYPCSVSILRNHFEGKNAWVLFVNDLIEFKRLETKLQQAQKLESLGTLAAGIAHELNTPIQFVSNNTRFLKDSFESINQVLGLYSDLLESCKGNLDLAPQVESVADACKQIDLGFLLDEIPQAINQTLDGTLSVSRIVKAMKGFSHPGCDNYQDVDINSIIENTLIVSRSEWKYCSDLVTDFTADLPLIRCLPGELNQVFLNIIVNSSHAMQDANLQNSDSAEPGKKGTLTVRTGSSGDFVFVEIQDTGTGIPEAIRDRVFDPFFTTKGVGKGTGQGLAISYGIIVELHHGAITFKSAEGVGTTFRIELPTAQSFHRIAQP